MPPTRPDEAELRKRLSPLEFDVTQKAGTERPFTGKFNKHKENGVYACVVCGEPLFASDAKFDSGTGWPSFFAPVEGGKVETKDDRSHGMVRAEARCASCAAHLGHVFDDGPAPTGERYCINSAALNFKPAPKEGA